MTTLTLDDKLAEQLMHIAAAQGKSLNELATEALQQLTDTARTEEQQSIEYPPEPTEGERLLAFLKPHWDAQTAHPEQYQPNTTHQQFGDHVEESLWNHWAEDLAKENSR